MLNDFEDFGAKNFYITTPMGRIRYFDLEDPYDRKAISGVRRESKNTPIQGCNAEIIKLAGVYLYDALWERFGDEVKIVNIIHDELNVEAPPHLAEEAAAVIKAELERAGNECLTNIPIIAETEIGDAWSVKE